MGSGPRVVLVRPRIAGNVGAVARLIANFAAGPLYLVDPECDWLGPEARQRAARGEPTLEQAHVVSSIEEAGRDMATIWAFSARTGGKYRRALTLEAARAARPIGTLEPPALVFGPEDRGLTNDEVASCHQVVMIPTSAEYPALNLSHAVAIALAALCVLKADNEVNHASGPDLELRQRAMASLEEALYQIGFLREPGGDARALAFRQLLARARPNDQESRLLFGLARQIAWFANPSGAPTETVSELDPSDQ